MYLLVLLPMLGDAYTCNEHANQYCSNHGSGLQLMGAPDGNEVVNKQDCMQKCKDRQCTGGYFHDSYEGRNSQGEQVTFPMICKLYGGSATQNECIGADTTYPQTRFECPPFECTEHPNQYCSNHGSGLQFTGAPDGNEVVNKQDCIQKCKDRQCTGGYFHDSYDGRNSQGEQVTFPMICKLYGGSATQNECIGAATTQPQTRIECPPCECAEHSAQICSNHGSGLQLTGAPDGNEVVNKQDCINKCQERQCTGGYFHDSYDGPNGQGERVTHPMICKLYGGSATQNGCIPMDHINAQSIRLECRCWPQSNPPTTLSSTSATASATVNSTAKVLPMQVYILGFLLVVGLATKL